MQYDKTFTSTYLYNCQKDYKPTTMSGTLQNKCQIRLASVKSGISFMQSAVTDFDVQDI